MVNFIHNFLTWRNDSAQSAAFGDVESRFRKIRQIKRRMDDNWIREKLVLFNSRARDRSMVWLGFRTAWRDDRTRRGGEEGESLKRCWIIPRSPVGTESSNNSRGNGEGGRRVSLTVSNNTEYLTNCWIFLSRSRYFHQVRRKIGIRNFLWLNSCGSILFFRACNFVRCAWNEYYWWVSVLWTPFSLLLLRDNNKSEE